MDVVERIRDSLKNINEVNIYETLKGNTELGKYIFNNATYIIAELNKIYGKNLKVSFDERVDGNLEVVEIKAGDEIILIERDDDVYFITVNDGKSENIILHNINHLGNVLIKLLKSMKNINVKESVRFKEQLSKFNRNYNNMYVTSLFGGNMINACIKEDDNLLYNLYVLGSDGYELVYSYNTFNDLFLKDKYKTIGEMIKDKLKVYKKIYEDNDVFNKVNYVNENYKFKFLGDYGDYIEVEVNGVKYKYKGGNPSLKDKLRSDDLSDLEKVRILNDEFILVDLYEDDRSSDGQKKEKIIYDEEDLESKKDESNKNTEKDNSSVKAKKDDIVSNLSANLDDIEKSENKGSDKMNNKKSKKVNSKKDKIDDIDLNDNKDKGEDEDIDFRDFESDKKDIDIEDEEKKSKDVDSDKEEVELDDIDLDNIEGEDSKDKLGDIEGTDKEGDKDVGFDITNIKFDLSKFDSLQEGIKYDERYRVIADLDGFKAKKVIEAIKVGGNRAVKYISTLNENCDGPVVYASLKDYKVNMKEDIIYKTGKYIAVINEDLNRVVLFKMLESVDRDLDVDIEDVDERKLKRGLIKFLEK